MQRLKFSETEYSSQSLEEKLLGDANVQQLLAESQKDASIINANLSAFLKFSNDKQKCEKCQGLQFCLLNSDGIYNGVSFATDYPLTTRKRCHYRLQKDESLKHASKYRINLYLSDRELGYDLDKIDLSGESNKYKQIYNFVKKWSEDLPEKGLYLYGGFGVGKTYLAVSLLNTLAKKGHSVGFAKVSNLASEVKNNIEDSDKIIWPAKKCEILVLDDIGAEYVTEWFRDEVLFNILDYRMEHHLKTIFTSNSDFDALKTRMMYNQKGQKDEVKADRMMERIRTLSMEVPMDGQSRRR